MARPIDRSLRPAYSHLLRILGEPAAMAGLTLKEWTDVVAVARHAGLLARLAELAHRDGIIADIPEEPGFHLEAARSVAEKHHRDVLWELRHVGRALSELPGPIVALKGASYVASGVASRLGRTFGDIDIIVPRTQLDDAERRLKAGGWQFEKQTPYDVQYYRRWTHQLPPMRHKDRGSAIDLHHALRPPIAPGRTDIVPLFEAARPFDFGLSTPSPTDMVIHSATHLFFAVDFRNSLRDLSDIDLMLREFGGTEDWWRNLLERSRRFNLVSPVAMALLHAKRTLGTPVPPAILAEALAAAGRGEHRLLDYLFTEILPPESVATSPVAAVARALLAVRGYLLDMPPSILAAHLAHKLAVLVPKHRGPKPEPV